MQLVPKWALGPILKEDAVNMKVELSHLVAEFQVSHDPEMPGWYNSNALGVNCTLNLPIPFSVKPVHIAAAAPEQPISRSEAPF